MSANLFMIYQINDLVKSRDYRCRPYEYQIENGFMVTSENYVLGYKASLIQGVTPGQIRERMEKLNPDRFRVRKFGVSDVIVTSIGGKMQSYYVNPKELIKFNGFFTKLSNGEYLLLNEQGYQVEGQKGTWTVTDEKTIDEQRFVLMVNDQKPDLLPKSGSQLAPEKVLECKYLRDKDERCGYVSGLIFFNQMGLTTQVPMMYEVVSNKATSDYRETSLAKSRVIVRKPKVPVTEKNYKALQFLDMLKDVDVYSEVTGKPLQDRLYRYMDDANLSISEIEPYFAYYPDKLYKNLVETRVIYKDMEEEILLEKKRGMAYKKLSLF